MDEAKKEISLVTFSAFFEAKEGNKYYGKSTI